MADSKTKTKVGLVKYMAQVRQEARKVVWPNSREVMVTTILVLITMVLFGIFFFIVDWAAANGVTELLKIGTGGGSAGLGG